MSMKHTVLILLEFIGTTDNESFNPPNYRVELRNYQGIEAKATIHNFAVMIMEYRKHVYYPQLSTRKRMCLELARKNDGTPFLKVFTDEVIFENEDLVFWNLLRFCNIKMSTPKGLKVSYLREDDPRVGPGELGNGI